MGLAVYGKRTTEAPPTTFEIKLGDATRQPLQDALMANPLSALVVDDSQTVRLIITQHLNNIGISDVDMAEDGNAALERLRQRRYDLMISDWEMQPMSGEQLLKAVRQDPKSARMPIILITGTATRGTSWLAGANAYLPKPFTDGDFQKAIAAVFGKKL